jgi:hypothetical protein
MYSEEYEYEYEDISSDYSEKLDTEPPDSEPEP